MFYQVPEENLQAGPHPATPAPVLLTVRQFAERHLAFTQGAMIRAALAARRTGIDQSEAG